MSETAAIISAVAVLVGSISGVVLAMSKLGPFMTALNKFLAERHKRATEAKNSAAIQRPRSASTSTGFWSMSRMFSVAVILVSFIAIVSQFFAMHPASPRAVVTCTVGALNIILIVVIELNQLVMRALFEILERPSASDDQH